MAYLQIGREQASSVVRHGRDSKVEEGIKTSVALHKLQMDRRKQQEYNSCWTVMAFHVLYKYHIIRHGS